MSLHRRVAAPVVALSLIAAGCGGTGRPAPATWAASVCSALAPWRATIDGLTAKAQQQLSSTGSAAKTKQNLVELLAGAQAASETARAGVAAAGIPDVTGGERIAARFVDSLRAARDAYGNARTAIDALDTADLKAFNRAVAAAFAELNREYAGSALDTSNVNSVDLQKAFAELPQCR
jgi:hypothetical protein